MNILGVGLKRLDLQKRAVVFFEDSVLLLRNKRYSSSYYLAGYAVELGLKSCIARQIGSETIPDKTFMKNIFNHDFTTLVGLAGLKSELKESQDKDSDFASFWGIVGEWTPDSRYNTIDPTSCQLMLTAIGEKKSGVMKWIKTYW